MIESSYLITVRTALYPTESSYQAQAEALADHVKSILGDECTMKTLTSVQHAVKFACEVEVQVDDETGELMAQAGLDISSDSRVQFDKGKFSKLIKQVYTDKDVKIEKRSIVCT